MNISIMVGLLLIASIVDSMKLTVAVIVACPERKPCWALLIRLFLSRYFNNLLSAAFS